MTRTIGIYVFSAFSLLIGAWMTGYLWAMMGSSTRHDAAVQALATLIGAAWALGAALIAFGSLREQIAEARRQTAAVACTSLRETVREMTKERSLLADYRLVFVKDITALINMQSDRVRYIPRAAGVDLEAKAVAAKLFDTLHSYEPEHPIAKAVTLAADRLNSLEAPGESNLSGDFSGVVHNQNSFHERLGRAHAAVIDCTVLYADEMRRIWAQIRRNEAISSGQAD